MLPANREFYHAHIPGETRGMGVILRAKDVNESWNKPQTSYSIGVNPAGGWGISKLVDYQFPRPVGWSKERKGTATSLASGKGKGALPDGANQLRLRVKGSTISLYLNGELLGEHTDRENPIEYGGFGVKWRYESVGWIRNLKVAHL